MKILITENQFKKLIENILIEQQNNPDIELEKKKFYKESNMKIWFLENVVDKVKQIIHPYNSNVILFIHKDTKEVYMKYEKDRRKLQVDYYKIWSYFKSNYSDNHKEIQQLTKNLMGEAYNLWNIKQSNWALIGGEKWENL